MGKLMSLIIGSVVTTIGVILLFMWWYELLFIIRAVLPLALILGGGIAVIAGISELKDVLKSSGE